MTKSEDYIIVSNLECLLSKILINAAVKKIENSIDVNVIISLILCYCLCFNVSKHVTTSNWSLRSFLAGTFGTLSVIFDYASGFQTSFIYHFGSIFIYLTCPLSSVLIYSYSGLWLCLWMFNGVPLLPHWKNFHLRVRI